MAILEKEVWVTLSVKKIKHYEDLGYNIPKRVDKWGRLSMKKGTQILVKVEDLTKGSNVFVTKICDDCEKRLPNKKYESVLQERHKVDEKDRCFDCGKIRAGQTIRDNVPFESSLLFWTKENNKEYLLEEFSDKNILTTDKIYRSSNDHYLWRCRKCTGEYKASVNSRTNDTVNKKGTGCPYCAGQKALRGYNDLWTTHSEVAKLLKISENGYEITNGCSKKEIFVCPKCNHEDKKRIATVVRQGYSCSRCGDGVSYGEKFMMSVLSQLNIQFETQKMFGWSKNVKSEIKKLNGKKIYDFYIKETNTIIETHGRQHYDNHGFNTIGSRTLTEEQENDLIKNSIAIKNGITNYIVVNCFISEPLFIKNSILNSELKDLYNLSGIDWDKCKEFATSNLIKTACDYWNSGIKNTTQIANLINSTRGTVVLYLKQGVELGWCNYDPNKALKDNWESCKKPIVQLTMDNKYIRGWGSIKEAQVNLQIGNISLACSGKYKQAKGYKWMYKEDYEKFVEIIK